MDQLTVAVREQGVEGGQLGETLIKKGFLTQDGLQKILQYQAAYLAKQGAGAEPVAKPASKTAPAKTAGGRVGASTAPISPATAAEIASAAPGGVAAPTAAPAKGRPAPTPSPAAAGTA